MSVAMLSGRIILDRRLAEYVFLERLGDLVTALGIDRPFIGKELRQKINEFHREGNRKLSERTGLEPDRYGYF